MELDVQNLSFQYRSLFACKVCGNIPDETGEVDHGRGCYTQSSDGGGSSWEPDVTISGAIQFVLECVADKVEKRIDHLAGIDFSIGSPEDKVRAGAHLEMVKLFDELKEDATK